MSKISLILRLFVVASSLAVVAHKPVFAEPGIAFSGTFRDTSAADASQWMVKYLGGQSELDPVTGNYVVNETFEWEKERSYVDGVLDTTGYVQVQTISEGNASYYGWRQDLPWIGTDPSGFDEVGYFSYVTIINDASFTSLYQEVSFTGLSVKFNADDHTHAIIINGVLFDGFDAQDHTYPAYLMDYVDLFILPVGGIFWNVGGDNVIEFIVHNSGWYENIANPTGLSAAVQASYAAIPEPSAALMFGAGVLLLPLFARRLREKQG